MPDKKHRPSPNDRTERERRKGLTPEQIREMELSGGVEGGMQAGSGGPERPSSDESSNDRSPPDSDRE